MHTASIGALVVACVAICLDQWPVNEAPQCASEPMLLASGALVVYSVITTLLLQRNRRAVYALHALGFIACIAALGT
jgi:hypothetical protein